jgi:F-type H+-transporting ATPase subunit delta
MKSQRQTNREAKQLFRFCLEKGWPDEQLVRMVAQALAHAGHRGQAILKPFVRLLRLRDEERTAIIESARPLTEDLRNTFAKGLTRRYGAGLTFAFRHRPALLGGVRIRIGSDVYDGSVQARLAALEKNF